MPSSRRLRPLAILLFLCAVHSTPIAQTGGGQSVKVRWEGINYSAHIIGTDGSRYHIRYDEHRQGRADEEWVGIDRLKNSDYSPFRPDGGNSPGNASGAGKTAGAALGMPSTAPTGRYTCVIYNSGMGLVNNGEFTLLPNGAYERGGTRGRYMYASGTGRVTFQGGVMDGRAAQYESRAVPTLHLMGNAGHLLKNGEERPVASCERQ